MVGKIYNQCPFIPRFPNIGLNCSIENNGTKGLVETRNMSVVSWLIALNQVCQGGSWKMYDQDWAHGYSRFV